MADKSKIEWTEATWNPITGCSRASEGCRFCYAALLAATRLKHHPSRAGLAVIDGHGEARFTGEVRFNEAWLADPLRWKRPRMIFVCAHADLFHENVPGEWIDRVFAVMALAPQHTFQVLTKRSARMREYVASLDGAIVRAFSPPHQHPTLDDRHATFFACIAPHTPAAWPLPNVWLGTSVEDQQRADERIPDLLATPAAVRWLSCEPLLGPVDLTDVASNGEGALDVLEPYAWEAEIEQWRESGSASWVADFEDFYGCQPNKTGRMNPTLDWIVCGGESGRGARPMHPDWTRSLRDQCQAAIVPFFFKQWGEFWPAELVPARDDGTPWRTSPDASECWLLDDGGKPRDELDPVRFLRVSKKRAGRMLDGVFHDAMPINARLHNVADEQPKIEELAQ